MYEKHKSINFRNRRCAGTVLCKEQVDTALATGTKFIVTPGLDLELVTYCQSLNLPIFLGCTTPTDYHTAYKLGIEVLKFFPAEQSGDLSKIKAMKRLSPLEIAFLTFIGIICQLFLL